MKIKASKPFLLSWIPALAVMGILFYTSSLPGDEIRLPPFPFSDKLIHFLAYLLLGATISLRFSLRRRMAAPYAPIRHAPAAWDWYGMSVGMSFGISDEIHQLFVPMRMFGLGDMAADFLGAAAGCLCYRMLMDRSEKSVAI